MAYYIVSHAFTQCKLIKISEELRNAVARLAKQFSTEMVQHNTISSPLDPLLACRLIPLDKSLEYVQLGLVKF